MESKSFVVGDGDFERISKKPQTTVRSLIEKLQQFDPDAVISWVPEVPGCGLKFGEGLVQGVVYVYEEYRQ